MRKVFVTDSFFVVPLLPCLHKCRSRLSVKLTVTCVCYVDAVSLTGASVCRAALHSAAGRHAQGKRAGCDG